jgi:hypothetical protein
MRSLEGGFQEGDVILTNHPAAGGSHLPDLTVITPVFYKWVTSDPFYALCMKYVKPAQVSYLSVCPCLVSQLLKEF